ncbi:hypothetical protein L585_10730 [Pantoea ananatis BRT175]|nr:hypothetical protein L585_10730 [Pantoea ananatis BRT175]
MLYHFEKPMTDYLFQQAACNSHSNSEHHMDYSTFHVQKLFQSHPGLENKHADDLELLNILGSFYIQYYLLFLTMLYLTACHNTRNSSLQESP